MIVYRVAKTKYIRDLSGNGSRLYGSRWTPRGVPGVYTSENRALAALEFYVHRGSSIPLRSVSIASIEIPAGASILKVPKSKLPSFWKEYTAPEALQDIGEAWIRSGELVLQIPSVQIEDEFNFLINPSHPDAKKIKIKSVSPYTYDPRM